MLCFADQPPESALTAVSNEIAPDRTPFIGREREQALALAELQGGSRLLTLSGPAGVGKTRLARQVLRAVRLGFEESDGGGAYFTDLTSCKSLAELEALVAGTLEIPQPQGPELPRAIANRGRMLLVLDNLDHIAREAAQLLGEWLDRAPQLQLLVTSIVPTGMDGEMRLVLGPLEESDAVRLYVERAYRAWVGKIFSDVEREAIEELVERLDRIPLAIELAAARVRVLPPRALLARIGERFELLQSERPGRHSSLLKALSLTWELLSDDEKLILSRASIFVGGFTLEAAEAILGGPELSTPVVDLLEGLRGKALVQIDERDPPRFSLYESVREFVALQLERSGDTPDCLRRHAAFFVAQGERHDSRSKGRDPLPSIEWLHAERENLIAAHRRSLGDDPAIAARAGFVLAAVMEVQGPPDSEAELLDSTLAAARETGDPLLLVRALCLRADGSRRFGRIEAAQADLDAGLQIARDHGNRLWEGYLGSVAAHIDVFAGKYEEAFTQLQDAARIGGEEGDPQLEGKALLDLTRLEYFRSRGEPALQYLRRALAIYRRYGPIEMEGHALLAQNVLWARQERFEEARLVLREAKEVFRKLGNRSMEAHAILNLGGLEVTAGRPDQAEGHLMEALELERRFGHRSFEATALGNLGLASLQRGQIHAAIGQLVEARELYEETGLPGYSAEMQWYRAIAHSLLGQEAEARKYFAEADTFFEEVGDTMLESRRPIARSFLDLTPVIVLDPALRGDRARSLAEQVQARLAASTARSTKTTETLIVARRLLERTLLRRADGDAVDGVRGVPDASPPRTLHVGPDAAWLQFGDAPRIDLRRRGSIRRMLQALVTMRLTSPGIGISQERLFEIGWQGAEVMPDAAAARVYVAIRILRTSGLADILVRHADGYLLDSSVLVILADG